MFRHVAYDLDKAFEDTKKTGLIELDPGFAHANYLSALNGRNYIKSILEHGNAYDGPWEEAVKSWDGTEGIEDRLL